MFFRRSALVLVLLAISGVAGFFSIPPTTLASPADIVARRVSEPVTVDGTATESFWAKVAAVEFPLTATMEGGGHVPKVTVKMANDGSNLYVLFQWADPTESRLKAEEAEDRFAIMVSLDPGNPKMASPCMKLGTNGAALAGQYDQWHWKAARTDSQGANFTAVTRNGVAYTFDHPYSFALDEFGNTTARYREGLTEYNKKDPNDPMSKFQEYDVKAKGVWADGQWTFEVARKYTTADPDYADKQFKQGETFTFALAVYDGGQGEDEEIKSITSWHSAQLSDELLTPAAGPDYTLYAVVAVVVVVIALGAFFALRRRAPTTQEK